LLLLLLLPMLAVRPAAGEAKGVAGAGPSVGVLLGVGPAAATAAAVRKSSARPKQASCMEKAHAQHISNANK
jgi:hypothetical protein